MEMPAVFLCKSDSIRDGAVQIHRVNEVEIALICERGELYAYRNLCPHQGGPACEGDRRLRVIERIDEAGNYLGREFDRASQLIICPWHGYSYNLKDGSNICDPRLRLQKYSVEKKGDDVFVLV